MIKQWQERTAEITGILTTRHIQEAMQAEIDELRSENARLRDALIGVAARHAWLAFGECRAFSAGRILTSAEADKVARAALGEK